MTRVPVKALYDGSDPQLNLTLLGGEEIRVPTIGSVVVSGNVRDPGVYPVQESGTTTVMTAIAQAKGLADYQPKIIYILRPDDQGTRHEIPVDLDSILKRKKQDVVLQAKDLLFIPMNNRAKATQQAIQVLTGVGAQASAQARPAMQAAPRVARQRAVPVELRMIRGAAHGLQRWG